MTSIFHTIRRFVNDESGVTAIEYGLIAGLIAVGIIGAVGTIGTKLTDTFGTIRDQLPPAAAPAP
jgi:pilus assembly protein Flp/PilA